jgi:hypothetical protein
MRRVLLLIALVTACSSAEGSSEPLLTPDSGAGDTSARADNAVADGTEFDIGPSEASSCVPTETVETKCNAIDDDCNGAIDDVDVGKDGICDCLGVLILGTSGSLAASTFETWLKSKGTTTKRRLDSAGGPLAATDLAGIDIVILDRLSRDYAKTEIDALQAFVKGGGALIAMTGYDHSGADATRPNLIIEGLGAKYDTTIRPNAPITEWDTAHPIAKDMTSVTFAGGYAVTPVTGFKTAIVARSSGNPVAVAVDVGTGRAFIWGDEWIEYDSEWATIPAIPKLWANIFGWVVQRRCGVKIF